MDKIGCGILKGKFNVVGMEVRKRLQAFNRDVQYKNDAKTH